MQYSVANYCDPDTMKIRYAVFCSKTYVFYFADRYGKKAAQALCDKLNKEVKYD